MAGYKYEYRCPQCGTQLVFKMRVTLTKRRCPQCGMLITPEEIDYQKLGRQVQSWAVFLSLIAAVLIGIYSESFLLGILAFVGINAVAVLSVQSHFNKGLRRNHHRSESGLRMLKTKSQDNVPISAPGKVALPPPLPSPLPPPLPFLEPSFKAGSMKPTTMSEVELIAARANSVLALAHAKLTDDYYYNSLPLCVIDAVYSIGIRYDIVRRIVSDYCDYVKLLKVRPSRQFLPPVVEQQSVSQLLKMYAAKGDEAMATEVFRSRHRTSTRSGVLKATAVRQFALALQLHDIEHLQDVPKAMMNKALEADVRKIPGQSSGISLQYFWMLAGSDDLIKPDRMIIRFLEATLRRDRIQLAEAQVLLAAACDKLRPQYPNLTPRLLDYEIWKYQRAQPMPEI